MFSPPSKSIFQFFFFFLSQTHRGDSSIVVSFSDSLTILMHVDRFMLSLPNLIRLTTVYFFLSINAEYYVEYLPIFESPFWFLTNSTKMMDELSIDKVRRLRWSLFFCFFFIYILLRCIFTKTSRFSRARLVFFLPWTTSISI